MYIYNLNVLKLICKTKDSKTGLDCGPVDDICFVYYLPLLALIVTSIFSRYVKFVSTILFLTLPDRWFKKQIQSTSVDF